jgi:FlaG/FlaF family flagellin (archaellin)
LDLQPVADRRRGIGEIVAVVVVAIVTIALGGLLAALAFGVISTSSTNTLLVVSDISLVKTSGGGSAGVMVLNLTIKNSGNVDVNSVQVSIIQDDGTYFTVTTIPSMTKGSSVHVCALSGTTPGPSCPYTGLDPTKFTVGKTYGVVIGSPQYSTTVDVTALA